MQNLEVISINIWQILISLANLAILFFIMKKFLYGPLKKVLSARQEEIDRSYEEAENAEKQALESKNAWDEKLKNASEEANALVQSATARAELKGDRIVSEAKEKADRIVKDAEKQAELERTKARESIKKEIVSVSTALAEKMLEREINEEDHREMINDFIDSVGESDERS